MPLIETLYVVETQVTQLLNAVSVEFTTLDDEVPGGPQSFGAYIISQATGFLRYAAKL